MSGGAAAYRKGRAGEYLARAHLEQLGWYVTRSYASKGAWDLLALRPGDWPLMVQVKVGARAYLSPDERGKLVRLAVDAGAQAIVCMVPQPYAANYEGVTYARYVDKDRLVPYDPATPIT